jgi:glycine cleavage system H protein
VSTNDSFSEIESTKSVNDVYAPVSGRVSRINDLLVASPELLNSDPYGDGWICEIEMTDSSEGLLSPDEYGALIG